MLLIERISSDIHTPPCISSLNKGGWLRQKPSAATKAFVAESASGGEQKYCISGALPSITSAEQSRITIP